MNILLNLLISVLSLKVAILGCSACTPEQKVDMMATATTIEQYVHAEMDKSVVEPAPTPVQVVNFPTTSTPEPVQAPAAPVSTSTMPHFAVAPFVTRTDNMVNFRFESDHDVIVKLRIGNSYAEAGDYPFYKQYSGKLFDVSIEYPDMVAWYSIDLEDGSLVARSSGLIPRK